VSLDNQRAKVASYAALNDFDLVSIIADEGISAKSLKRVGIQTVIELVKGGKVDAVIVLKLDRLSRSVIDTLGLLNLFDKKNVAFHSIQDKVDTKTATGRFFLNILSSLSQMERELIGERTRDALAHKIRNLELCGSLPWGWTLAEDGVHLLPHPHEQKGVALIVRLRNEGYSYRAICRELTKAGYLCRLGKWHVEKVKSILRHEARRSA
jgi:DNA invertase Pin-like site-specific DNA recombinase